ncbi:uncharacterized protein [Gossypium hirsutum]|uniref:Gag-Pol polyprotein n=1 Tax=Gossypium hirsutum TaxID=3635 RepID=A0ABM2YHQ2_GOSHI|nr:uncharacterized protein LOC107955761 [Gossypium hirsutum]
MGQGGGASEAYLQMMDAWYSEFVRANPNSPPPPPPPIPQYASPPPPPPSPIPQYAPVAPQGVDMFRREKPSECVSTEAIMYKRFEDGLNEDIRVFVGILEIREFVVLVERACKVEELVKEKRKATIESWDLKKRQMGKAHQSSSKRLKEFTTRLNVSVGYSRRNNNQHNMASKAQATSIASVGSAWPNR